MKIHGHFEFPVEKIENNNYNLPNWDADVHVLFQYDKNAILDGDHAYVTQLTRWKGT
jgi:hypothetical protein